MRRAFAVAATATVLWGTAPTLAQASQISPVKPGKVAVCKYVSIPGEAERLQTGNNPIEVDQNAIPLDPPIQIGDQFVDAQIRSVVVGLPGDTVDETDCPPPVGPPTTSTTTTPTTSTTTSTTTTSTSSTSPNPPPPGTTTGSTTTSPLAEVPTSKPGPPPKALAHTGFNYAGAGLGLGFLALGWLAYRLRPKGKHS